MFESGVGDRAKVTFDHCQNFLPEPRCCLVVVLYINFIIIVYWMAVEFLLPLLLPLCVIHIKWHGRGAEKRLRPCSGVVNEMFNTSQPVPFIQFRHLQSRQHLNSTFQFNIQVRFGHPLSIKRWIGGYKRARLWRICCRNKLELNIRFNLPEILSLIINFTFSHSTPLVPEVMTIYEAETLECKNGRCRYNFQWWGIQR